MIFKEILVTAVILDEGLVLANIFLQGNHPINIWFTWISGFNGGLQMIISLCYLSEFSSFGVLASKDLGFIYLSNLLTLSINEGYSETHC